MSRSLPAWVEHIAVLAAFTLLALLTSFPLITDFGNQIAGVSGDVWSYLWAMGWARISVLNLVTNPFHTNYVFYPLGGATQLLWGTALPSFASIPLQIAFGLVPAFNLMYLAASILTGYGMYLLAKEVLRGMGAQIKLASFVAAVTFTFCALRLGYGIAFTNLFHTEFIPFYVLMLLRTTRLGGWKNGILAGLFFAFNVYIDFQIAAFLTVLTALWFLYRGIKWQRINADSQIFYLDSLASRINAGVRGQAATGLLILVAVILALPMYALVLNDFSIEGGDYIQVYPLRYSEQHSYDVLSYILPNARSTLYQIIPAPKIEGVNASITTPDNSELSPDEQAFLGIVVLILAVIGIARFRSMLLFWILVAVVFALLSLGPVLHVVGREIRIPLPYTFAGNIPFVNHIRIPMRYGLFTFFGVSLLTGAGALVVLSRNRWLVVPIVVLILIEAMVLPYPILQFQVPSIYKQIGQDVSDFTILEIPTFNWRQAAKNEVYQDIHQKHILRAYTNRIAPDVADYFGLRQTPIVVKSLRILEGAQQGTLDEEQLKQDRAAADATIQFFNLRYAIVHRDQLTGDSAAQIDAYLRDVLRANVISDDGTVVAYTLPQANNDDDLKLNLAQDSALMYLGRGWQTEPKANINNVSGRYLKGVSSEIYLPDAPDNVLNLFTFSPFPNLSMQVQSNGTLVLPLSQNWKTYSVPLSLSAPMNLVRLFSPIANSRNRVAVGTIQTETKQ